MVVLVNQRVKAGLRCDEYMVLAVRQLQRQPLRAARVGKLGWVGSIRLTVKKAVARARDLGQCVTFRLKVFHAPVSPTSWNSLEAAWPKSTVKSLLALSTRQVLA